jgi:hypothetical protein
VVGSSFFLLRQKRAVEKAIIKNIPAKESYNYKFPRYKNDIKLQLIAVRPRDK